VTRLFNPPINILVNQSSGGNQLSRLLAPRRSYEALAANSGAPRHFGGAQKRKGANGRTARALRHPET
jgi:hypothetical protein